MKSFATTTLALQLLNAGVALAGPILGAHHATPEKRQDASRPWVGQVPYGSIITQCTVPGTVALTYDDGPADLTIQLMDILDSYGVKATFFVAGANQARGPIDEPGAGWIPILQRMYTSGHHIASHTWNHPNLNELSEADRRSQMTLTENSLRNIFGWIPTYMRPPYLECNSDCLNTMGSLGYHVVNLNVDTKDYENDDPALIQISKDRYASGISGDPSNSGYIVLSHDTHHQTVVSLTPYMIELARERGFRLVTLGECLGDPQTNWYRGSTGGGDPSTPPTTPVTPPGGEPTPQPGLTKSPNAQCGGSTGYTCAGSGFGDCCSVYGWCGSTPDYCGTGCNPLFGNCPGSQGGSGGSGGNNGGDGGVTESTNGLCGPGYNANCAGFGSKTCCSKWGYCGISDEHCGSGCQSGFGFCN